MRQRKPNCACIDPEKFCVLCHAIPPEGDNIAEMVKDYVEKKWKERLENRFDSLITFTDFICGRPNKLQVSEVELPFQFCKDFHQFRMTAATIKEAEKKLKKAGLDRLNTFEEVYKRVLQETKDVKGFGILAAYDFSIRYCWKRKLFPKRVYLQAGAYNGAKKLINAGYPVKIEKDENGIYTAELSSFPIEIMELRTVLAEDFLCIYKSRIETLSKPNSNK
ncbi:MAG: hypothetical protein K2H60_08680 [Muribaculaceae bacterium]|nr:hypothetical protein [Muribaculaceae bacterium]